MKKILSSVILSFLSISLFAQTVNFELQANGTFMNVEDGKSFSVINRSGKSKAELYSEILVAITRLYDSPKDGVSSVENEIISVNGVSANHIMVQTLGMKMYFTTQYTLQFQFKDEKIRVDAPIITYMISHYNPETYTRPFPEWLSSWKLFKGGEVNPKRQNTIDGINRNMNEAINSIINNKIADNEDW